MESLSSVNFLNLLIGILLIIGTILYLIYTKKSIEKDKDYNYWIFSYDIKIIVGTLIFFVIGIIMVYRELSKIQFAIFLCIAIPGIGFSQNKSCDELKHGVFEVHENNEKVGRIYRKGGYQLEDYLDGKKLKTAKIREENCLFYINNLEIESDLDTVTMFTRYDKIKKGYYAFLAKPIYLDIDYEYRGRIKKISDNIAPDVLEVFKQLESKNNNVPK